MLRAVVSDGTLLDDQVLRGLALEEAGAFICSFTDAYRASGVRWEGQLIVVGKMHSFQASSLRTLCDRMEAVRQRGRVSVALQTLPDAGDRLMEAELVAAGSRDEPGSDVITLPCRPRQPGTHRRQR
jgi:hypothetical protein